MHADDTFDIDYDDGEQELRVTKDMIRLLDGGGALPAEMSQPRATLNQALTHSKELELEAMEHTMASMQEKNIMMMDLIRVLQTDMEAMKKRERDLTSLVEQQGALLKKLLGDEKAPQHQQQQSGANTATTVGVASPSKKEQPNTVEGGSGGHVSVKTGSISVAPSVSASTSASSAATAAALAASVASAAVTAVSEKVSH